MRSLAKQVWPMIEELCTADMRTVSLSPLILKAERDQILDNLFGTGELCAHCQLDGKLLAWQVRLNSVQATGATTIEEAIEKVTTPTPWILPTPMLSGEGDCTGAVCSKH